MVDVGTIFAGVGMFTAIVMSLAVLILLARSRLVSTDDVNIEINDDPERALTVEAGGKLLTTLAALDQLGPAYAPRQCHNMDQRFTLTFHRAAPTGRAGCPGS